MCGLAGEIRFDGRQADIAAIERANDVLAPRGPDDGGLWWDGATAVAGRRLSIIDESVAGAQPMVDQELGLTIAFNGCIYDHAELRGELEKLGHTFRSHSDTEVIAKAYAEWGVRCVERFHGMFAFAIIEHESGRLVLARDRLGVKPLYVDHSPERLRFASTLPALLAAGGVDTSIDAVALTSIPQPQLDRPVAADDHLRRPEAAPGHRPCGRVRRHDPRHGLLGPPVRTGGRAGRLVRAGLAGRPARCAPRGGRGADSSPTSPSASCCPAGSTRRCSSRWRARPATTISRPSASASPRWLASMATSSPTPTSWPGGSTQITTGSRSPPPAS